MINTQWATRESLKYTKECLDLGSISLMSPLHKLYEWHLNEDYSWKNLTLFLAHKNGFTLPDRLAIQYLVNELNPVKNGSKASGIWTIRTVKL